MTVPLGTLATYDVGVTSFVLAGRIPEVPLVAVEGLPADARLDVLAAPIEAGEWAASWDHVLVQVAPGVVARSEHAGDVIAN